jgi:hypothetical protein
LLVIQTDPSAGICLATLSITIKHPGFVIIGICNLGSGSLCQLKVDLGSFNKILTLPSLYFEDMTSITSLKYVFSNSGTSSV